MRDLDATVWLCTATIKSRFDDMKFRIISMNKTPVPPPETENWFFTSSLTHASHYLLTISLHS